jgi:raffinose/stachyose/melibiose transport system permease protein
MNMRNPSVGRKIRIQYATLVAPGMLVFTVGLIVPMILGLRYSLTSWNGFTRDLPWVALGNYVKILHDPYALDAWWFTIKFTFWNTVIQNLLALTFAVVLDSELKARKVYRTILFVPCLVSPIIVGFVWLRMFSNVLPAINSALGTNINFLLFGSARSVLSGLLVANNWQWIGYWMVIYLAALQSIPRELYEAAHVDGASWARRFFGITIPMLAPAFTICIVGITIGSLKVYELIVSSTGGGPGRASTSIVYQIYNTAISGRQYGYGSALSMTLVVVLLIVAVIQVSVLRKREVQL